MHFRQCTLLGRDTETAEEVARGSLSQEARHCNGPLVTYARLIAFHIPDNRVYSVDEPKQSPTPSNSYRLGIGPAMKDAP